MCKKLDLTGAYTRILTVVERKKSKVYHIKVMFHLEQENKGSDDVLDGKLATERLLVSHHQNIAQFDHRLQLQRFVLRFLDPRQQRLNLRR